MQHMVSSIKNTRVLDGDQVIWPLDHAKSLAGSALILTNSTRIFIRQVEADRAKSNLFFYVQNGPRQFLSLGWTASQDMEGQSGRRLLPYSWESCQSFYQVINGLGISSHISKVPVGIMECWNIGCKKFLGFPIIPIYLHFCLK